MKQVTVKENDNKKEIRCPMCNSTSIRKTGFVLRRTGRMQRYQCKEDAHTFYVH